MFGTQNTIAGNSRIVTDDVKAFGHDVLRLAASIGAEAKSQADDIGDTARDQTRVAYAKVKARISKQPAMALGAAVGVGLLLGFLAKSIK